MELKTFSTRRASQNAFELTSFVKYLNENGVKRYLEIGARHGDTFHHVMNALPKGSYGLAVDLPGGLWGTSKSANQLQIAMFDLKNKGYDAHMLLGNSTEKDVIEQIREHGPFDAVFIDGDHTLSGVTKDWEAYRDMAPIVAFHDIVGTGQKEKVSDNPVEVPLLWETIKKDYECIEFIDHHSNMGIGVCKSR